MAAYGVINHAFLELLFIFQKPFVKNICKIFNRWILNLRFIAFLPRSFAPLSMPYGVGQQARSPMGPYL
jgi:hypothetical protein